MYVQILLSPLHWPTLTTAHRMTDIIKLSDYSEFEHTLAAPRHVRSFASLNRGVIDPPGPPPTRPHTPASSDSHGQGMVVLDMATMLMSEAAAPSHNDDYADGYDLVPYAPQDAQAFKYRRDVY